MRVAIATSTAGTVMDIGTITRGEEADVRRQLEPVLPFARYTLDQHESVRNVSAIVAETAVPPSIFKLPLRLGSHLWCADEAVLAPHLGCGGAALLAWTLLRHLDPTTLARN